MISAFIGDETEQQAQLSAAKSAPELPHPGRLWPR